MVDTDENEQSELLRTLDYILNRCDETAIDALAKAVVRRRRELTMFGGRARLPNPKKMAKELAGHINLGGLRKTIRGMAVNVIKEQAPELNEEQIAVLSNAWIPGEEHQQQTKIPPDMLAGMVDQFARFSQGGMSETEDAKLRAQMGAWPQRYWKAFPEVIKLLVKEHLDGKTSEEEFRGRLRTALLSP